MLPVCVVCVLDSFNSVSECVLPGMFTRLSLGYNQASCASIFISVLFACLCTYSQEHPSIKMSPVVCVFVHEHTYCMSVCISPELL